MTRVDETDRAGLAIVIVAHNSARWLPACLSSITARGGDIDLDIVVVDSESTDDVAEVVGASPGVRLLHCRNRGFAHGNNRGIEATTADWVLLLNADTEIVDGTLADLVKHAAAQTRVGVVGVKQVSADGSLQFTMRRFPSVLRSLGESLASEAWPVHPALFGERVLNHAAYERETDCDWTSGSFMLLRRAALEQPQPLDERFFLYARGARSLSAKSCVGLVDASRALSHDHSPRRQRGLRSPPGCAARLLAALVHGEALLSPAVGARHRRDGNRLRASLGGWGEGRTAA